MSITFALLLFALSSSPSSQSTSVAREEAAPVFSWGDFDGDDRLDLAAVNAAGELRLLSNASDSRFDDVTDRVGLSEIGNAALASWADYDGDGRLDLFVGARAGASRLFHNDGGAFIDMTAGSGLASEGAVRSAQWLDFDGDGRLDLFVVTPGKNQLFRGLEGGFFELAELPLAGANAPEPGGSLVGTVAVKTAGLGMPPASGSSSEGGSTRAGSSINGSVSVEGVNVSGGRIARGASPGVNAVPPLSFFASCLNLIRDQANPGLCLSASTTPALGKLYPLSTNLFVATSGAVGIGTTSPAEKLSVAGNTWIENSTASPNAALEVHQHDVNNDGIVAEIDATGGLLAAVRGVANGGEVVGVWGQGGSNGAGVVGVANEGVVGFGTNESGVNGMSTNGIGVKGSSANGHGVRGETQSSGSYAVFAEGAFGGTGAKYFVQPHPSDASKEIRFICLEGNESGTYFRGSAHIVGGRAVIDVPEDFRLTTESAGLTVQVTPIGAPASMWIESENIKQIVVRSNLDVAFHYFVNGVRRGYADQPTIVDNDSYIPAERGKPFGTQYPRAIRDILVGNGILNADYTPNEATAARLGWKLGDENERPSFGQAIHREPGGVLKDH